MTMKGPISALKLRRRKRMSVEVLEDRQLLATITVNATADSTAAGSTLSLRQAIEVSNGTLPVSSLSTQEQAQVKGAVGNTNTINFNIPTTDPGYNATTGVWTIALKSGLPAISTNAAIIDGYSQPGAAENTLAHGDNAKLKIAVIGSSAGNTTGLPIAQPGSQVRGLDIENFGFNGTGIVITAAGNVQVAGCFIGTNATGTAAAPNYNGVVIENSSNVIGGPNVGDRNVISGNSNDGLYVVDQFANPLHVEPTGNVIENNLIGTDVTGTKALGNFNFGVWDYGSGNTYGGTTAGLGNVISGNVTGGIRTGGSVTIEGNYLGTDVTGNVALGGGDIFAEQDLSGSPVLSTVITNNLVSGTGEWGISVNPSSQPSQATYLIANNLIGTNAAGTAALGNALEGLFISADNASILDNVISGNAGVGIRLSGCKSAVVQGNAIGTDRTGQIAIGNTAGGIVLSNSTGSLIGGTGQGQGNVVADNGGIGIEVDEGQQNRITRNSIFGNAGPGIYLGPFVSQAVPAPVLTFAPGAGSSGTLSGTLKAASGVSYTIEIFSNPSALVSGQEQGKTFVQDVTVNTDGSGKGTFSVTEPVGFYAATAIDPSGNTSPFSNAVGSQGLAATQTTVSSSSNPSTVGQPVTFTAVVTAPGHQGTPTGTVTFSIDGQAQSPVQLSVVGGMDEAQFTTATLSAGSHTVSASYSGNTNVAPSYGSLPTQTVTAPGLQATTTTLTSSLNPATVGQPVTFSAVVTAPGYQGTPTGTVIFIIDGQAHSPVQLSVVGGVDEAQFTTSTLSAGLHTVTASYSGDSKVSASSGSLATQTVTAPGLHTTTTTLASSLDPSTVGQTVTFTAIVSPGATAGTPTGTVTFTIDGVSQAPVPLHVVNGSDRATLSIASLARGTHTIRAAYSGDSSFAASAVATPLVETVKAVAAPGVDGPTVESVKRFGIHMQPTVLVVSFSEALDPASAVNLRNYRITDPCGQPVRIRSAVYDVHSNTVTLRPAHRINLHHRYYFMVVGTGPDGVRNTQGMLLDGADTGRPDSDYRCALTWRNVRLTPAEFRKYVHPGQATPAGALNQRFLHAKP
jgi:parallel beta-helix repeat protein